MRRVVISFFLQNDWIWICVLGREFSNLNLPLSVLAPSEATTPVRKQSLMPFVLFDYGWLFTYPESCFQCLLYPG